MEIVLAILFLALVVSPVAALPPLDAPVTFSQAPGAPRPQQVLSGHPQPPVKPVFSFTRPSMLGFPWLGPRKETVIWTDRVQIQPGTIIEEWSTREIFPSTTRCIDIPPGTYPFLGGAGEIRVRDARRSDSREHGGGVDFYLHLKDYWPVLLRFRPVWHIYGSGQYPKNVVGYGLKLSGRKMWMDHLVLREHGTERIVQDHDAVQREVGIVYERDLVIRWTLRTKPHQLEKSYLPMSYAGTVMDAFPWILKDHRGRTGYHFDYSSNHVRENTRFIRNVIGLFFPKMFVTDWTLVCHGTPGPGFHYPDSDSIINYLFAMGIQRRTITSWKVIRAIVAVGQYFLSFVKGDMKGIVKNYINAIEHVTQQQAAGSALIPGLRKIQVIKPLLHKGGSS